MGSHTPQDVIKAKGLEIFRLMGADRLLKASGACGTRGSPSPSISWGRRWSPKRRRNGTGTFTWRWWTPFPVRYPGGPDYLLQFMEPRVITENTMRRGFSPDLLP